MKANLFPVRRTKAYFGNEGLYLVCVNVGPCWLTTDSVIARGCTLLVQAACSDHRGARYIAYPWT